MSNLSPSLSKPLSQKICLVGDFCVGKTSLIRQFVDRQFSDKYLSTVGVKISSKLVSVLANGSEIDNGLEIDSKNNPTEQVKQLKLMVWDIEGSTRFKAIAPNHLQGAKGAIVVGDVTRESSIQSLTAHIQLFKSVNPNSSLLIALNKVDLIESEMRNPLLQSILNTFSSLKVSICMTSAKSGEGVDEIFQTLTREMLMLK